MAHEHDHDHDHDHEGHDHDDHDHDHAEEHERAERAAIRRHALGQIRQYPDAALRLKAHEVTDFDDDLRRLVERMEHLMQDAQGVGLAATQVGVLRRLFVFDPNEEGPRVVVNPRLVKSSKERETDEEGCLSLQGVRVPVERATSVTLAGQDENGADVEWTLEGLSARVVQHELDHLDGVLIIDRTDDEHRKWALGVLRPQPVLR
ncbi:MAG TPA: peptide deformylase [Gaiellaceae bacterium]|nr:peptide deformylase [Gaiellaceae bacterium]